MKRSEQNVEAVLKSSLPTASPELIESARKRLYVKATSNTGSARLAEMSDVLDSLRPVRRPQWPSLALAAAIVGAVALAAALSPNIWKTRDANAVKTTSTTQTLADGSRIEMLAGAEAVVGSVSDGLMVRLNSGSMMVFAAKQAAGRHLYVQTRD